MGWSLPTSLTVLLVRLSWPGSFSACVQVGELAGGLKPCPPRPSGQFGHLCWNLVRQFCVMRGASCVQHLGLKCLEPLHVFSALHFTASQKHNSFQKSRSFNTDSEKSKHWVEQRAQEDKGFTFCKGLVNIFHCDNPQLDHHKKKEPSTGWWFPSDCCLVLLPCFVKQSNKGEVSFITQSDLVPSEAPIIERTNQSLKQPVEGDVHGNS